MEMVISHEEMGRLRMRAPVVAGPGRLRLDEVEISPPAHDEVRIKLEGSGVCASNLAVWEGQPWFEYPFAPGAPGHEGWGVIDAIGSGVVGVKVGDRVAALGERAYAPYETVAASRVVVLPEALKGRPFPGEPLGCAMNIFRRSRIEPGQTVAIVGIGFLGALLSRLISNAGARVLAISRRPFSLEVARWYGAHNTIEMDDHGAVLDRVAELTGGELCDRVIEATGRQWPLDLSAELTRERGTLVIAGYHQDGSRRVNMQLWNWRGLDVVNAHERDPAVYLQGIREAIAAVASGALDPDPLYTHTYPLERLDEALDAARERPDGFLKALVIP